MKFNTLNMKSPDLIERNLSLVRKLLIVLSILVFIVQLYLDSNKENIISNALALFTFVSTCLVIFNKKNCRPGVALTAAIIFLMITANSLAPMLGTLLEGHTLIYTLIVPETTYFHRSIFALTLLAAHSMARSVIALPIRLAMSRLGSVLHTRVLLPPAGLWGLGGIGFAAYMLKFLPLPTELHKLLDGFEFLLWAPLLLVIPPYSDLPKDQSLKWRLAIFYIVQIGMALVNNSRMGMIGPIAMAGSAWLVSLIAGLIIIDVQLVRRGIQFGIIGLFLASQFKDVSTAIVIERAFRETRSAGDQFEATFNRFFDKKSLEDYNEYLVAQEVGVSSSEVWQENYVQNPFLGRFVLIKYDDNCFDRVLSFGESTTAVFQQATIDKTIALLPSPLIQLLGLDVDKSKVNSYTIGDLTEVLSGRGTYGSFLVGSILANAYGIFSWSYPLILLFIYFLLFSLYQGIFSVFKRNQKSQYTISTLGLLLTLQIFTDISIDGVPSLVGALLRGVLQNIFIYYLALQLIRFMGVTSFKANLMKKDNSCSIVDNTLTIQGHNIFK